MKLTVSFSRSVVFSEIGNQPMRCISNQIARDMYMCLKVLGKLKILPSLRIFLLLSTNAINKPFRP